MNTQNPDHKTQAKPIFTVPDMIYDVFVEGVVINQSVSFLQRKVGGTLEALIRLEACQHSVSKKLCSGSGSGGDYTNKIQGYNFLRIANTDGFIIMPSNQAVFEISDKHNYSGVLVDSRLFGVITMLLTLDRVAQEYEAVNKPKLKAMFEDYRQTILTRLQEVSNFMLTEDMDAPPSEEEAAQIKGMMKTIYAFTQ